MTPPESTIQQDIGQVIQSACESWHVRGSKTWLGINHYADLIQEMLIANDEKVRSVPWPDDAPSQDIVPRAGDIRIWRDKAVVVQHGIPWLDHTSVWCLFCLGKDIDTGRLWIPVGDLEMPEEPEPKSFNEHQIYDAIMHLGYSTNLASAVVDQMNLDIDTTE